MVLKELLVQLVIQAPLDHRDLVDHLAKKVALEIKDHLDLQDHKDSRFVFIMHAK